MDSLALVVAAGDSRELDRAQETAVAGDSMTTTMSSWLYWPRKSSVTALSIKHSN